MKTPAPPPAAKQAPSRESRRKARLAAALRANLQRRKSKVRDAGDSGPKDPAPGQS